MRRPNMRDLVLFVLSLNGYWRCQLGVFGDTQPDPFNFAHNYSYGFIHRYNYEYKDGEYVQSSNFPILPPKPIEEFRRQNIPMIPIAQRTNINANNNFNINNNNNDEHFHIQNDYPSPENVPRFVEHHQTVTNPPRKSRQNINRATNGNSPLFLTVNGSNCVYGFCEHAENYPETILLDLVKNNKALSTFFKIKVPSIADRGFVSFENICEVTKHSVFPKTAKNVEGKNRIVVNLSEYKQVVESEVCREDAICRFHDYWPEGYTAKCLQKYVEVPLAVMDDMENKIIVEKFSYPSGCYCACKNE